LDANETRGPSTALQRDVRVADVGVIVDGEVYFEGTLPFDPRAVSHQKAHLLAQPCGDEARDALLASRL
jgi:hypothetical protein